MNENRALELAIEAAQQSPCAKSKRGVICFAEWENEGSVTGFNGPPPGFGCDGSEACRKACAKTCVHAEVRALLVRTTKQTDLLHIKVIDGKPVPSGPPSCWQCSRLILDQGVRRVWLLHEDGLRLYSAEDFHRQTLQNAGLPVIQPNEERTAPAKRTAE